MHISKMLRCGVTHIRNKERRLLTQEGRRKRWLLVTNKLDFLIHLPSQVKLKYPAKFEELNRGEER